MKRTTGVRRLDEMLGGGLPEGGACLAYGPPFCGMDVLARRFAVAGLPEGEPAVLLLTASGAGQVREQLAALDPGYLAHEEQGLVRYIDAYSRMLGEEAGVPGVEYVDGPMNLNGISVAVNSVQRALLRDHASHRFVFDNVSALVAHTNAQTAFRFLQVLVGKAARGGATSLVLLEKGMHADPEVQMFKLCVQGVIEAKVESSRYLLHVEGLGVNEDRGWVEYRFSEEQLDVIGSFAAGRIR